MQELVQNSSAIRAMFEEGRRMAAEYGAENVYDFPSEIRTFRLRQVSARRSET